jgi:hypothetical protein
MKMSRKQHKALSTHGEPLEHRPGDPEAILGGGTTTQFIDNHQRPVGGPPQSGVHVQHLCHEGGDAAKGAVSRAHTGDDVVDEGDPGSGRGNKTAYVGQEDAQSNRTDVGTRIVVENKRGNQYQAFI